MRLSTASSAAMLCSSRVVPSCSAHLLGPRPVLPHLAQHARPSIAPARRASATRTAATAAAVPPPVLAPEAYVCLGLAHCFEKSGSTGKLAPRMVIEPLSSSSLESIAAGARTSYKAVIGMQYGSAITRTRTDMPDEFQEAIFCENFGARCDAAARTWTRPHAMDNLMDIVPLGKVRSNWNFSLEDKRVLNFVNVVSDEDNIRQDLSIDVYGRTKKDEIAATLAAEKEAAAALAAQEQKEKEEDDLEKLLSL